MESMPGSICQDSTLSRLVGHPNVTEIIVNGNRCTALIDSGAEVSTVPESFIPVADLQSLDIDLTVNVAGNQKLTYSGMAEIDLNLRPDLDNRDHNRTILSLVIPDKY